MYKIVLETPLATKEISSFVNLKDAKKEIARYYKEHVLEFDRAFSSLKNCVYKKSENEREIITDSERRFLQFTGDSCFYTCTSLSFVTYATYKIIKGADII